jgi:hypothetical protein
MNFGFRIAELVRKCGLQTKNVTGNARESKNLAFAQSAIRNPQFLLILYPEQLDLGVEGCCSQSQQTRGFCLIAFRLFQRQLD